MDLKKLTKDNPQLVQMMQQAAKWRRLDQQIKKILLPNMQDFYQVACIKEQTMVIHAQNAMIASRLKMTAPALLLPISELAKHPIQRVQVKVHPQTPEKAKQKQANLSHVAQTELAKTSEAMSHHPELALALKKLSSRNKNH